MLPDVSDSPHSASGTGMPQPRAGDPGTIPCFSTAVQAPPPARPPRGSVDQQNLGQRGLVERVQHCRAHPDQAQPVHVAGPAAHRGSGGHVLGDGLRAETLGREHRDPACVHVIRGPRPGSSHPFLPTVPGSAPSSPDACCPAAPGADGPTSRSRTATCTAPSTIFGTIPTATRPVNIWTMVTMRATSVFGAMSPNPTVAKTVTVK